MRGIIALGLMLWSINIFAQTAEHAFEQKMQDRFQHKGLTDKKIVFFDTLPQEREYNKVILYLHSYADSDFSYIHVRRNLVGRVNPEVLADRIIRYQFGLKSKKLQRDAGTSTKQIPYDEVLLGRQIRAEIDKSPEQKELLKSLQLIAEEAKDSIQQFAKTEPTMSERIMSTIDDAAVGMGYGISQKNPHPESLELGLNVRMGGRIHPLALFPSIANTKYEDTIFVDLRAGYIQYQPLVDAEKKDRVSSVFTIGTNLGPFQLYGRERAEDFAPSAESPKEPRFERNYSKTAGFRFNFRNEQNPHDRSYAYIDYESFKFSDKPFEAPVIRETAALYPHWPMVKVLNPNSGLLLGYLLSVGYVADLSNQFPVLIPALGKIFSRPIVEIGAVLRGSAMGTDDPDAITILAGAKIKIYNRFYIGLIATYATDITQDKLRYVAPNEPGMSTRNSIKTLMVMIEVPFFAEKDENSGEYVPFRGPQKLVVQKFENFNKIYSGPLPGTNRVPLFRDGDETNQKVMENGLNIDLAYQRFLFKNVLSYVSGKNTEFSKPGEGKTYDAFSSQIHYRLTQSSSVYAKLAHEGRFNEVGIGIEVVPLKTDRVEVKIYGEREIVSNFPCLVRPNQIVGRSVPDCGFRAGFNAEYDLLKFKFFTAALTFNFNLFGQGVAEPKMVDWRLGAKVKSRFLTVELPINNNCINLGDSNGFDPHGKSGEGKGGAKCNSYFLATIDLLEIYRALTGSVPEDYPQAEVAVDNNIPEGPIKVDKSDERPSPMTELGAYSFGQHVATKLLSDIGVWIKAHPQDAGNTQLLEKTSEVMENIGRHFLFVGKYYYDRSDKPNYPAAIARFNQVLHIFDPQTDFDSNKVADEEISRTLKYYFADPAVKPYLQRQRDQVVPETLFCLSQAYKASGNSGKSAEYLAELKAKYPSFETNPGWWARTKANFKEHQCY